MSESDIPITGQSSQFKKLVAIFNETMNVYGDHLKLFGGSSILMNFVNQGKDTLEVRPTKDLDFFLYQGEKEREQIISEFKVALSNIGSYSTEIKQNRKGNYKVIFTDKETGEKIHADLQFKSGVKYGDEDIATLDETLKSKLRLKMEIMDRRFKDLVDVMTILDSEYPRGITKKELLNVIDDKVERISEFLKEENMEDQLEQAKKFVPPMINTTGINDYLSEFYELMLGLDNEDVGDYDFFAHGKWHEGEIY